MTHEKTIAVIQARMGSSRFPGKVLADIAGKPMLQRVVERVAMANLDNVVVATTTLVQDDCIVDLCKINNWEWFRGSENDVLSRYCAVARSCQAKYVVRITADCPLVDSRIITLLVRLVSWGGYQYGSNVFPVRTFPRGLDIEVIEAETLYHLARLPIDPAHKEHVTTYIRDNAGEFRIRNLCHHEDLSGLNWSVDYEQDLEFPCAVYSTLGGAFFHWADALALSEVA